jgi:hypothetical protein
MPDRSTGVAFSIKLICIGTYGRVRPIEGCGLEEEKCCMQHKRCVWTARTPTTKAQRTQRSIAGLYFKRNLRVLGVFAATGNAQPVPLQSIC